MQDAAQSGKLLEPQIKAALIDVLLHSGWADASAVIVSEMPVAYWSRRADLVLANGRLLAFEIKSEWDSLVRLSGQLAAYLSCCEGVTVVCSESHARKAEQLLPDAVGLFTVKAGDGGIDPTPIRRPYIRLLSPAGALQHLSKTDLCRLLNREGVPFPKGAGRATLNRLALDLPASTLRSAALKAVKDRYRDVYSAFLAQRAELGGTRAALPALQRPAWKRSPTSLTEHESLADLESSVRGLASRVIKRSVGSASG